MSWGDSLREFLRSPSYLRRLKKVEAYCREVLERDTCDEAEIGEVWEKLREVNSLRTEILSTYRALGVLFALVVALIGFEFGMIRAFGSTLRTIVLANGGLVSGAACGVAIHKIMASVGRVGSTDRAEAVFNLLSILVPPRISREELGDALEDVQRRVEEGRPRWEIELKIWATSFWVLLHAVSEVVTRGARILKGFVD